MPLTIEMNDPVGVIMREVEDPKLKQGDVALTYAFIIAQEPDADFSAINAAIRKRWKGKSALGRIKEAAWKQIEEWVKSGREKETIYDRQ